MIFLHSRGLEPIFRVVFLETLSLDLEGRGKRPSPYPEGKEVTCTGLTFPKKSSLLSFRLK